MCRGQADNRARTLDYTATSARRSQRPGTTQWRLMSVCSASGSFVPTICRGFTPCNPNNIGLGDSVTIDLCIENASEMPLAGDPPYPLVAAALDASSKIEVFLMCRESECSTSALSGLAYQSFVPQTGVESSFALGATASCHESSACGLLTLSADVPLPASTAPVCLGTIVATVTSLPIGSTHGLFYVRSSTAASDLKGLRREHRLRRTACPSRASQTNEAPVRARASAVTPNAACVRARRLSSPPKPKPPSPCRVRWPLCSCTCTLSQSPTIDAYPTSPVGHRAPP